MTQPPATPLPDFQVAITADDIRDLISDLYDAAPAAGPVLHYKPLVLKHIENRLSRYSGATPHWIKPTSLRLYRVLYGHQLEMTVVGYNIEGSDHLVHVGEGAVCSSGIILSPPTFHVKSVDTSRWEEPHYAYFPWNMISHIRFQTSQGEYDDEEEGYLLGYQVVAFLNPQFGEAGKPAHLVLTGPYGILTSAYKRASEGLMSWENQQRVP